MASNSDDGYDTVDAVIAKPRRVVSSNIVTRSNESSLSQDEGFDSSPGSSYGTKQSISKAKLAAYEEKKLNLDSNALKESCTTETISGKQLNEASCVKSKAESLAVFIVWYMLGKDVAPKDKIDETLLSCVKDMLTKHEIKFKGMMKRINIDSDTGYSTFVTVANELFEGDKNVINWGRVIALYSFAAQIALYCKHNKMEITAIKLSEFIGKYASDVISDFVIDEGGWDKFCKDFASDEDRSKMVESKIWSYLTWTAFGLSVATAATTLLSTR